MEPASPAVAGVFFTTEPPGKPDLGSEQMGHMPQGRVDMLFCLTTWKNSSQEKQVSREVSFKKSYTHTSNHNFRG